MTAYYVLQLLANGGAVVHAMSVPESRWAAADRERFFWVLLLAFTAILGFGPVALIAYLTLVVPRFRDEVDASFRKVI